MRGAQRFGRVQKHETAAELASAAASLLGTGARGGGRTTAPLSHFSHWSAASRLPTLITKLKTAIWLIKNSLKGIDAIKLKFGRR